MFFNFMYFLANYTFFVLENVLLTFIVFYDIINTINLFGGKNMFCTNCGKNIPDGSVFCPECGKPTSAQAAQQQMYGQQPIYGQPAVVAPISGGAAAITQKVERVPTRLIAKIAFLAALVCFLFPFMSVSCDASTAASMAGEEGDYSFEIVYNGYNLIFPSTISEKNIKTGSGFDQREKSSTADSGENYGSKEGTNPWLIITAICCIAGSVILFLKRDKLFTLISAGCSLVSLICLIIFRANFTSRYISDGKTDLEGLGNYLKVNTKFGYVLCILMVILALISTLVSYLVEKPKSPQNFY